MSATEAHTGGGDPGVGSVDLKLEVQVIRVSDVDRAEHFHERLGFRLDGDVAPMDGLRVAQFTPPGSAEGGFIVSDIEAAHNQQLVGRKAYRGLPPGPSMRWPQ